MRYTEKEKDRFDSVPKRRKLLRAISFMLVTALAMISFTGCGSKQKEFSANNEIGVISREDGSGTRGAFVELFKIEKPNKDGVKMDHTTLYAVITNSTSVMMTTISGDLYAIGYISLGSLNDTVKAVKIDGAEASAENIENGTYKVARPFNIATKEEISREAQDFINFIMSDEGQSVVEKTGYIAVAEGEKYISEVESGKVVVSGSSSVVPVMEKLKEAYIAVNPGMTVEVQQSDSSTGMIDAIDGTCDIGMASRALKESELEKGLVSKAIAMDGIAIIVNNMNPVDNLTSEQVMNIFTGETYMWDEI